MARIPGSVPVAGIVAPTDDQDVYPVTNPLYQKGGWREVASEEEMNRIPIQRRNEGMIVAVAKPGADTIYYEYKNNQFKIKSFGGAPATPDGSVDMTKYYTKDETDSLVDAVRPPDLTNYFTKDETYGKADVDQLLQGFNVDLSDYYTIDQVDRIIDNNRVTLPFTSGPTEPTNSNPGDVWLNTDNGLWYTNINGKWVSKVNAIEKEIDTFEDKFLNVDKDEEVLGNVAFKSGLTVEKDAKSNTDVVNLRTLTNKLKGVTGGGGLYTNDTPCPVNIGGIPAGTTFAGLTNEEMWNMLLYPYQAPSVTGLNINIRNTLEVGTSTANTLTVSWTTNNQSNIKAGTVRVFVNNIDITPADETLPLSGTKTFTITPLRRDDNGSIPVKVRITDVKNNNKERTVNINWGSYMYFGTSNKDTLTEDDIKALSNKEMSSNYKRSYNFGAGGYKYVCYPNKLGTWKDSFNSSNKLPVPMTRLANVNVTNGNGVTQEYAVYRTSNVLGGSLAVTLA